MNSDIKNVIEEVINRHTIIDADTIPSIDLYMDQVTTFIEDNLATSGVSREEKLLTKTMINNYTKAGLIPPPVKKKYSKNHMIMLIFIYYYKSFISINDSKKILEPLKEGSFDAEGSESLINIYKETCDYYDSIKENLVNDINDKINLIEDNTNTDDESEYRQLFSLFNMLSYDIFIKKHIMEELIDRLDTLIEKDN